MGLHREAVDTTAVLPFVRIGTACYLREESRYELLALNKRRPKLSSLELIECMQAILELWLTEKSFSE